MGASGRFAGDPKVAERKNLGLFFLEDTKICEADVDKHTITISSPTTTRVRSGLDKVLPKINLPKPIEPDRLGEFGRVILKSAEVTDKFKESLIDAVERKFVIDLKTLSTILYYSFAILSVKKRGENIVLRKSYDPPMGFYDIALWLFPRGVEDLPAMLYKYDDEEHALLALRKVSERLIGNLFARSLGVLSWIFSAPVLLFIIADIDSALSRFGIRGLRYVFIEAGEVLQNIRLIAAAVGLQAVGTAAFVDDFINRFLNIDYPSFAVLSIVGLGVRS